MHRPTETRPSANPIRRPVIVCFSHLRWNLVFQRPQHILTRLLGQYDVMYWEEPRFEAGAPAPRIEWTLLQDGLARIEPVLPEGLDKAAADAALAKLLEDTLAGETRQLVFWYYTPIMLAFSAGITPDLVVYDNMDELANFAFAPHDIERREAALLARADVVLCGGRSLYKARAKRHHNIHCVPSGVDVAHFARGAGGLPTPADHAALPRPASASTG
ncbi:MAG: hypothetical protein ACKO01_06760 [Erythrobacter sp.]